MVGPEISRRLPYNERLKVSFPQVSTSVLFVLGSVIHNYVTRRPLGASMLKHAASVAAGFIAGGEIDKFLEERRNQNRMIIEDYICRHPEDFPLVTPKKYKDVLLEWNPLR